MISQDPIQAPTRAPNNALRDRQRIRSIHPLAVDCTVPECGTCRYGHRYKVFTDAERQMIEVAPMFFLATSDGDGFPDVSYKGGLPGFVRVTGPSTLEFPNYDGNGMYKSLGNVVCRPEVGLLFVRWHDAPKKLRIQGRASLHEDESLRADFPGAQLIVRVEVERIFDNCPRYLHRMTLEEHSIYAPSAQHEPPIPDWKSNAIYRDALPERDLAALARWPQ